MIDNFNNVGKPEMVAPVKKMKLELANYTCACCGHSFDAPTLGGSVYGEFLLRTRDGEMAYLNAFEDATYQEVDNLLSKGKKTSGLTPIERARILRHVYGSVACDKGSRGSSFDVNAYPPCPICSGQRIIAWEFKTPPEIVEVSVPEVTHRLWFSLSADEKMKSIDVHLAALGPG